MKKLLAATLVFSFCTADAGLFGTIKSKVGTLSGKAATFLDQQVAGRTAGSSTTSGTVISNPTLQSELMNILNTMYEEARIIRKKNLLKPKILYYASNLCVTLQKCISAPSSTSTNISFIESYIKELQSRSVDVTKLNSQLVSLKTSSTNFNNSVVSINDSTIDPTVKQEVITILSEMNAEISQISSTYLTDMAVVTNSTLLQKKLQECIANPANTSASIDTFSEYIQKLQEKSVNVTSLNQKLILLKDKTAHLIKSESPVDLSKINSNILGEFLTASNEVQSEISKFQNANSTNSTLVSYSGQINNELMNCSRTFIFTSNHVSAFNQYIQWMAGQGVDVTSLNQKFANLYAKATNFNNAKEVLVASSDVQQEISKIQSSYTQSETLTSCLGQISGLLQSCSQAFVVTPENVSAFNEQIQILAGQGVNVSGLSQKLTNFNEKVANFNKATAASATATSSATVGTTTAVPATVLTNTMNTSAANTVTTAPVVTTAGTANVVSVGTVTTVPTTTSTAATATQAQ